MSNYLNVGFEHLFPYSHAGDFVLKRTMIIGERVYSVLVMGNYAPYSGVASDAWGMALVVDNTRTYLGGGYNSFYEALAAARGALATLIAVKQELGESIVPSEDDIVKFVLTHGELNDELRADFYQTFVDGQEGSI